MCGRFAQYRSMRDYLRELDSEQDAMSVWEGEPIQRYNVAPSTQVQVLHSTGGNLVVAEVRWGWAPNWTRGKMPPPINARLEKVATGKFFKQIWQHRALVAADGWFEWVQDEDNPKIKQPYYIRLRSGDPLFFAAIGQFPLAGGEASVTDGFVIITADAEGGMIDVHDRRPVVLSPELAREWVDPDTTAPRAEQILLHQGTASWEFEWFPVDRAVGDVRNDGPELIRPANEQDQGEKH